MVITFKSRASGDVIMHGESARKILHIIGKDPEARQGIITVEQLPDAMQKLNAAIEEDRVRQAELEAERQREKEEREQRAFEDFEAEDEEKEKEPEPPSSGMAAPVSLHQRGWPLLNMMRYSQQEATPVIWDT